MLDGPAAPADLRQSLADVARLNALFGGRRVTLRHVTRLLSALPADRALTVLDVGAGSADIARALVRWARRARRPIRVFALDQSLASLGVARDLGASYPEILLIQGDALALPVRPASVDVVVSALTLHHFEPDEAARHVAEMDRAARRGRRRERSHAKPDGVRARLAGDAGPRPQPDVAPRWAAVRAARVRVGRGARAVREGRPVRRPHSPLSAAAPPVRGADEIVTRVDVAVVGAGPAGAATASLLAERGWSTVLLDKARFPRPKICGEYLSPEAARVLDRLGVLKDVDAAGAQPLRGMRIVAPDGTALAGRYPTDGPWRGYRDHALAVPREVLDRILVERAKSLPVHVRERHRVTGLRIEGDRVTGVEGADGEGRAFQIESRLVVGADGRASIVARALGLVRPHRLQRLALIQDVEGLDGFEQMGEIYVDPPDYSILNPVAPGLVNLSLVVPLAHARPYRGRLETFFDARLKQLRHVWPRLQGMRPRGPLMAMGPLAYRVAEPRHGGVLLAGDAAGFYDPFTGEGLFTALRSAELLAETAHAALERGDLSARALRPYARARRRAFGDKQWVTRALQLLIRRRRLANLVARAIAPRPRLLDALMGVIGDFVPPRDLLRPSVLRSLL